MFIQWRDTCIRVITCLLTKTVTGPSATISMTVLLAEFFISSDKSICRSHAQSLSWLRLTASDTLMSGTITMTFVSLPDVRWVCKYWTPSILSMINGTTAYRCTLVASTATTEKKNINTLLDINAILAIYCLNYNHHHQVIIIIITRWRHHTRSDIIRFDGFFPIVFFSRRIIIELSTALFVSLSHH